MYHLKAFGVGLLLVAFVALIGGVFAFTLVNYPYTMMSGMALYCCYWLGLLVLTVNPKD